MEQKPVHRSGDNQIMYTGWGSAADLAGRGTGIQSDPK